MRKIVAGVVMLSMLGACASNGGVFGRKRPDEMSVTRAAPLVVPPDFALAPPRPGEPRPQEADSSTQALQAMFGGPAPRSDAESAALSRAGQNRAQPGIRSNTGDPGTVVADKGQTTRDIIAAPEGDGAEARAGVPK